MHKWRVPICRSMEVLPERRADSSSDAGSLAGVCLIRVVCSEKPVGQWQGGDDDHPDCFPPERTSIRSAHLLHTCGSATSRELRIAAAMGVYQDHSGSNQISG